MTARMMPAARAPARHPDGRRADFPRASTASGTARLNPAWSAKAGKPALGTLSGSRAWTRRPAALRETGQPPQEAQASPLRKAKQFPPKRKAGKMPHDAA